MGKQAKEITAANYPETLKSLNSNLGLPLSVKFFGAKGDASYTKDGAVSGTDDTAAFEAAMLYCKQNGGGRIFVPAGNYLVKNKYTVTEQDSYSMGTNQRSAIRMYDNTELFGEGEKSKIICYQPDANARTNVLVGFAPFDDDEYPDGYTLPATESIERWLGRVNIKVHDLYFDGRSQVNYDASAVSSHCMGVNFYSSAFSDEINAGLANHNNIQVYNCEVYDVNLGIRAGNKSTGDFSLVYSHSHFIYNNKIDKTTNKAIELSSTNRSIVRDNIITNADYGLQSIFYGKYNVFENNSVDGNFGISIAYGSQSNVYKNNTINAVSSALVFRADAGSEFMINIRDNLIIENNLVNTDNTKPVIAVYGNGDNNSSTQILIINNKISNNTIDGYNLNLGYSDLYTNGGTVNYAIDGLFVENNIINVGNIWVIYDATGMNETVSTGYCKDIRLINNILRQGTIKIKGSPIDTLIKGNNHTFISDQFIMVDDVCSATNTRVIDNITKDLVLFIQMSNNIATNTTGGGFTEISGNKINIISTSGSRAIEVRNLGSEKLLISNNDITGGTSSLHINIAFNKSIIINNKVNGNIQLVDGSHVVDRNIMDVGDSVLTSGSATFTGTNYTL